MNKFIGTACLVHAVFLISIFDIYFKSPIIPNLSNIGNDQPAFARRLVLFVADGLRADTFFDSDAAPFLRQKILNGSMWGISKAHIPTESRPGHVSLIAGILEDPSAVFKGWKHNPVDFDSVFNQTAQTFAWGSPDILSIFNKGNESCKINNETFYTQSYNKCHVYTEMYSPEFQDFSGASGSASLLNDWVQKKFLTFMKMAKASQTVSDLISREKVVFFLHLLGTDVAGHVNKPNSVEYIENIRIADEIVKQVVSVVSTFFNDNDTAFIFTSDHGMTDWGSHGAGSESEIDTPFVAWGAGIAIQEIQSFQSSGTWNLPQFTRHDINQSDVAPLMSVLLGIPIPANSVGILPINYLNASMQEKGNLLYLNARQIENQFNWKRNEIKKSVFNWMFYDYPDLKIEKQNYMHIVIGKQLADGLINSVQIHYIKSFIGYIISGLEYYHNFHQLFLCLLITFSYLGWISFLTVSLLNENSCERVSDAGAGIVVNIIFFISGCSLSLFLAVQSFPLLIHLYVWVATSVWWAFANTLKNMACKQGTLKQTLFPIMSYSLLYILGIEALVLAFFKREILTGIILVILSWPIRKPLIYKKKYFLIVWIWSCLCLSFFPFFPTVGFNKNIFFVLLCGALWLFGGLFLLFVDSIRSLLNFKVHCAVLCEIFAAVINIYFLLHNRESYVTVSYTLSWMILFSSLLLLYVGPVTIYARYLHIIFSLCAPYLLLSIGHEVFFTLILAINLICWIYFEHQVSYYNSELSQLRIYPVSEELPISHNDFRRSFFFLFYILFSFFGIGNVASINSFDVSWVYCFISVFSPFTMTGLILLKTLIPFLMVAVAFRLINIITKANTKRLFLILFIMSDIMGLNFFFRVSNKGSWLDIGLSISHYIIIETVILFLIAVYSIAVFITEHHSFEYYNLKPSSVLPHHFPSDLKTHGD